KNVLVLTPAPLVSQWKEEMQAKFGIEFLTTDDEEFTSDPAGFWKKRFIIASLNTAKSAKNMPLVTEQFYDLVVVDEAHHLKNRAALSWKLVNQLKKKFILLLTATPVQNNLIELFNLITILKPGQFKTEKQFKQDYLQKGSLKATADKDRLRALLRDVMIRNTRSAIDLKLPKRFATTMRLEPSETEREIYARLDGFIRKHGFQKQTIYLLLREAGSSPFALKQTLLAMNGKDGADGIIEAIGDLSDIGKGTALMEILSKNPGEKKIIFTQFIKSIDYIAGLLERHDVPFVMFRGDMSLKEKDAAIAAFRSDIPVLISTESGGEGRNLQFCNTIINFDLPWNPMRIEQRIGRLHRIGQTRDVFIFNLSVKDTIEDYIIDILDSKINMFEMVIGEIEPILGHLGEDRDFEDIILEMWQKTGRENLRELEIDGAPCISDHHVAQQRPQPVLVRRCLQAPLLKIVLLELFFRLELSRLQNGNEIKQLDEVVLDRRGREQQYELFLELIHKLPREGSPVLEMVRLVHHHEVVELLRDQRHVFGALRRIERRDNEPLFPEAGRVACELLIVRGQKLDAEFGLHLFLPLRDEGRRGQDQDVL
ncbi:hypothetical protein HKBW3S25_01242, partial [Candidatus Hakubella thermalkaliphila]